MQDLFLSPNDLSSSTALKNGGQNLYCSHGIQFISSSPMEPWIRVCSHFCISTTMYPQSFHFSFLPPPKEYLLLLNVSAFYFDNQSQLIWEVLVFCFRRKEEEMIVFSMTLDLWTTTSLPLKHSTPQLISPRCTGTALKKEKEKKK